MSSYRITSVDHVSTLPFPMASPSLARDGNVSYLVGPGLVRVSPGAAPEALIPPGQGVPMDAGVEVDLGSVTTYGGHPESDERGTSDKIVVMASIGIMNPASASLPFPRRGILAVEHGNKTVLFGGIGERGTPTSDVWLVKNGEVREMSVRLPGSGSSMQAGRAGRDRLFLLGSGATGADFLCTIDAEGRPNIGLHEPLDPQGPRHGVMVAQDGPNAFFFGFGKGDRGATMTLWHYSDEEGTQRVGDVALGDEPWTLSHGAMWVEGDAVLIAGGTRHVPSGGPFGGSNPVAEARVIRVGVERT